MDGRADNRQRTYTCRLQELVITAYREKLPVTRLGTDLVVQWSFLLLARELNDSTHKPDAVGTEREVIQGLSALVAGEGVRALGEHSGLPHSYTCFCLWTEIGTELTGESLPLSSLLRSPDASIGDRQSNHITQNAFYCLACSSHFTRAARLQSHIHKKKNEKHSEL